MGPLLEHEHENEHERGLRTIDTEPILAPGCVKSRRPRQRSGTVPTRNRRPTYHSLTLRLVTKYNMVVKGATA
jgi:hypothetical protein